MGGDRAGGRVGRWADGWAGWCDKACRGTSESAERSVADGRVDGWSRADWWRTCRRAGECSVGELVAGGRAGGQAGVWAGGLMASGRVGERASAGRTRDGIARA